MSMVFELPAIGRVYFDKKNSYFAEFIKRQFIAYYQGENISESLGDIIIENLMLANVLKNVLNNDIRLSRNFAVEDNTLLYKNFVYSVEKDTVLIRHKDCKDIKMKAINSLRKRKMGLYSFYHNKFYHEILFPLFSIYSFLGFFVLHGSLIQVDKNDNVVILGLDGVGKSSLSGHFQNRNGKSLSDNFLLTNGKVFIPLNLTMRMEKGSYSSKQYKEIYCNSKITELNNMLNIKEMVHAKKIFLVYIAKKIEITTKKVNLYTLINYCNGASEICEANSFISPFAFWAESEEIEMIEVHYLGIPKGKLMDGMEEIEKWV